MTEEREFEGKDLEEALGLAAEALHVPQEELHYEMLEAGRRGLLGLGVKNVRIRVKPSIDVEFPPEEPEVDLAEQESEAAGPKQVQAPAKKKAPPREKGPARTKRRSGKRAPASRKAAGKGNRRGNRRPPAEKKKPARPADPAVVESVAQMVASMVETMGLDLEVVVDDQEGGVTLRLHGADEQALVAKNSELLSAIQLLLNRMSRRAWPGVGRIDVGCNGHSKPRDEELVAIAHKVAKQVGESGKTKMLHPMNAYERRLVHLTVREFPGLTSSSDGNGALKRVRISKVQNQI